MRFTTKQIVNSLNSLNNNLDEEVIRLLKRNGYRPKATNKYMNSLYKRMKRKGYKLTNIQDINTIHSTVSLGKCLTVSTTIYLEKNGNVIDSTNCKLNERIL